MKLLSHKTILASMVLCLLAFGLAVTKTLAQHEHPGKTEHPGSSSEHPGKKAPPKEPTADDIRADIRVHIDDVLKKNNNLFPIKDDKTNQELKLQFVKVHDDKVSVIEPKKAGEPKTYFACTDFKDPATGTIYDLDFWMKQQADGKLKVTEQKIHKVGGVPRFTYENDKIVDIPVKKG